MNGYIGPRNRDLGFATVHVQHDNNLKKFF